MKKRVIFQILMALLIIALGYLLYTQIEEPIAFEAAKENRRKDVENKLIQLKKAQEVYRGITGGFAGSYKQLVDTLRYGKFPIVQAFEDNTDPDNPVVNYDTTGFIPAIDSVMNMGLKLEDIGVIPHSNGDTFSLTTQMIEYQATEVEVIRVEAKWGQFMGQFADPKYKKFDEKYDPNKTLGFGNLTKPILTGSWE